VNPVNLITMQRQGSNSKDPDIYTSGKNSLLLMCDGISNFAEMFQKHWTSLMQIHQIAAKEVDLANLSLDTKTGSNSKDVFTHQLKTSDFEV
jgi:hypothetical protein